MSETARSRSSQGPAAPAEDRRIHPEARGEATGRVAVGEALGPAGERLATEHLLRLGYEILERNYRTRWGELDIVARREGTLAFCEVKTRRAGGRAGGPFEAVSRNKQQRVRRMANSWLADRRDRPFAPTIRFDAIGITLDGGGRLVSLEHLEGAF